MDRSRSATWALLGKGAVVKLAQLAFWFFAPMTNVVTERLVSFAILSAAYLSLHQLYPSARMNPKRAISWHLRLVIGVPPYRLRHIFQRR